MLARTINFGLHGHRKSAPHWRAPVLLLLAGACFGVMGCADRVGVDAETLDADEASGTSTTGSDASDTGGVDTDPVGCVAEICDGVDNDCDGQVDEDFGAVTCGLGVCMRMVDVCVDGTPHACVPGAPGEETCNGFDDDCDGMVDEGDCDCLDGQVQDCYGGATDSVGIGECVEGTQVCVDGEWAECNGDVFPQPEACDDLDNDCDGEVDDGAPESGRPCDSGQPGGCQEGETYCIGGMLECEQTAFGVEEACNGVDDDCDGEVDEGDPDGGEPCAFPGVGECVQGVMACSAGALACAQAVFPTPEVCDGLDNDCNGQIDDATIDEGGVCPTGLDGLCWEGVVECSEGGLVCTQTVFPMPEQCSFTDEDCDGVTNNDDPGGGQPCSAGLPGECDVGFTACSAGWIVCLTYGPMPEVCDGLDNDCDGEIDEDAVAPAEQECVTGKAGVCNAGTNTCVNGQIRCVQNVQPGPEICNGYDDNCNNKIDDNCVKQ